MDWHERYARYPRPFGEEPTPFLREAFENAATFGLPAATLRILCPGDGYGRNGLWLAQRGHSVIGLDLVPSAVGSALSTAIEAQVDYVAIPADISGSPFPLARASRFDAIVSAWMRLPEQGAREAWNTQCVRRLRNGGAVVFIGGRRVTDAGSEVAEWPNTMKWEDFSNDEEVRLIGHKQVPPPNDEGTNLDLSSGW